MRDRLAIGTVQFGLPYGVANALGQLSLGEARRILDAGLTAGLDTLDTAVGYGESEAALGEIGVAGWRVVTKLPATPTDGRSIEAWVSETVQGSLQRLKIGRLYALLLHRPSDLIGPFGQAAFEALETLRSAGTVEKIGYSIYSPDELDAYVERFRPDIVQAPFNAFDQRLKATGWLDRLRDLGIELHTRSTFLQGLLLLGATERPKKFDRWETQFSLWDQWVKSSGGDAVRAALGFVLQHPQIARVIVGVDSLGQFEQVVAAAERLPEPAPAELAFADEDLVNPSRWKHL